MQEVVVSVCSVEGYSSVMRWMAVEATVLRNQQYRCIEHVNTTDNK